MLLSNLNVSYRVDLQAANGLLLIWVMNLISIVLH
jgi:hypothetical protein